MNKDFAQKWLNKLKEYWFNKDIEKAVSLFTKTTFYQETPFMKPYTTIEEINKEWQHVKEENIQEVDFKILGIKCVSGSCHSPVLSSESAPATLKYLKRTDLIPYALS